LTISVDESRLASELNKKERQIAVIAGVSILVIVELFALAYAWDQREQDEQTRKLTMKG
jgi:mannose/fructose-specific phosphotransferase system component IIA